MENDTTGGTPPLAEQYPGVVRAYDFVLPSYQWMVQRLEANHSRVQALQTFIGTVTLGAPVVATAIRQDITFLSPWFLAAMGLFVILVVLGMIARAGSGLILASPAVLYAQWLHYAEWEFKKNAVYWAGEHFEVNNRRVNRMALVSKVMTLAFTVEIALLVAWIALA